MNANCLIAPNYLTRTFHSVIQNSNLPQIRLHDLRHSVASNLLNLGFSVVQVQKWLGHGSASTTLNFYVHVDKSSKNIIANTLDKLDAEQEEKDDRVLEEIFVEKSLPKAKKPRKRVKKAKNRHKSCTDPKTEFFKVLEKC